jgi:hypothetical protein
VSATLLLTPAIGTELANAVRRGVPLETAATAAGISRSQVYTWLQVAQTQSWPSDNPVSDESLKSITAFAAQIRVAQAEFEADQVAGIAAAAQVVGRSGVPEWRARAWLLNNHPRTRNTYHEVKQLEQSGTVTTLHEHRIVREIADAGGIPALESGISLLLDQHPELADG